jgi:bacteriochlorophyll 4-vinyl reductase
MRDSGVGRLLVASLHEAIADLLPTRLGFYENWLHVEGLREGTIGLAPLYAVLSFLRQEGDAYVRVMQKAGGHAAEWSVAGMRPVTRSAIGALPAFLRRRVVLRRAGMLVHASFDGSRARWRMRRGTARVDLQDSVFCTVREPAAYPLCVFYAAAYERFLSEFDLTAPVATVSCRGAGGDACIFSIPFATVEAAGQEQAA